jgi:hypothetical protein
MDPVLETVAAAGDDHRFLHVPDSEEVFGNARLDRLEQLPVPRQVPLGVQLGKCFGVIHD